MGGVTFTVRIRSENAGVDFGVDKAIITAIPITYSVYQFAKEDRSVGSKCALFSLYYTTSFCLMHHVTAFFPTHYMTAFLAKHHMTSFSCNCFLSQLCCLHCWPPASDHWANPGTSALQCGDIPHGPALPARDSRPANLPTCPEHNSLHWNQWQHCPFWCQSGTSHVTDWSVGQWLNHTPFSHPHKGNATISINFVEFDQNEPMAFFVDIEPVDPINEWVLAIAKLAFVLPFIFSISSRCVMVLCLSQFLSQYGGV